MEKEKLLSICIPTYNREVYLLKAIKSIEMQLTPEIINLVEICINDNASTDNTEGMIRDYIEKNKNINITFNKNDKNYGADYNYIKSIDIAKGKFCWYLGSDDALEENSLKYVIEILKKHKQDTFIFLGTNNIYDFTLKIHQKNQIKHPAILSQKYTEDILIEDIEEISSCCLNAFGYLSVIIFNRAEWNKIDKFEKYYGTAYVHMYKLYQMIKKYPKLLYIRKEIVKYRSDNDFFVQDVKVYKRALLDIDGYNIITSEVFGDNRNIYRNVIASVIETYVKLHVKQMINENKKNRVKFFIKIFIQYKSYSEYWRYCFFNSLLIALFSKKHLIRIKKTIYGQGRV